MGYKSKAVRVSDTLEKEIRAGQFDPDRYLPGEDALAERYRVSRSTIRRVLEILNHDGVVVKEPNRGTMIAPRGARRPLRDIPLPRTLTFAWAYAAYPDSMISNVTAGIQRYVEEQGINLQIFTSSTGHEPVLDSIENAAAFGVNGVILLPYILGSYIESVKRVIAAGIPVVTISELAGSGASSVCSDDFGGAFAIVQHMIARHDRPCYFLGPTHETGSCIDRYEAFRTAMREAGFDAEIDSHTIRLDPDGQKPEYWPLAQKELHPREMCLELLDRIELPASVFCINDYIARGLYLAAKERGAVIGRDLMVAGYGDLPFANRMEPPLTTVRSDSVRIGYQAARVMHQHVMREVTTPVNLKIPVEFFERASI
ncbi:MAG: substrate-binding domain-containing protein [Lentisphaeria bacterium]|nr:substrate-binding domain-containing protein [Lentisphaeria bacterium]